MLSEPCKSKWFSLPWCTHHADDQGFQSHAAKPCVFIAPTRCHSMSAHTQQMHSPYGALKRRENETGHCDIPPPVSATTHVIKSNNFLAFLCESRWIWIWISDSASGSESGFRTHIQRCAGHQHLTLLTKLSSFWGCNFIHISSNSSDNDCLKSVFWWSGAI